MITGFRSILFKFVAFAVVAILLFVLLLNTMINSLPSSSRTFTAYFTSVSGLSPGSDVRVAGVRIGRVANIQLVPNGGLAQTGIANEGANGQQQVAAITLQVENAQVVYDTTDVGILYENLLGQRFISLTQNTSPAVLARSTALGSGAYIKATEVVDGNTIPITDPGFDLTALLNGFRPLFQVLQPAQINQLASSIIQVLQGQGGSIDNLLQQTTQVTNFLADRDQVVGQVLANLTPVLTDFAGQGTQLSSTVSSLKQLMDGLAADRTTIGKSITDLSTLITSTSDLIAQARAPITVDTSLFRQVVETTNSEKVLLTNALGGFAQAFGALGRVTSYKNAANIYLCSLTLDISGLKLNLSGNPNGGPWTGACQ